MLTENYDPWTGRLAKEGDEARMVRRLLKSAWTIMYDARKAHGDELDSIASQTEDVIKAAERLASIVFAQWKAEDAKAKQDTIDAEAMGVEIDGNFIPGREGDGNDGRAI